MKTKLGVVLLASSAMIAPAVAQQGQPNPAQAAAKALLQAADKATGASNVKSYTATGTGWMGSPGQQFAQGDLPRADLKSYTVTTDYATKSRKVDYVRIQGNNPQRGGGGIPIQGEQHVTTFVNGNIAWNLNAQGQPVRQSAVDAADGVLGLYSTPTGFIKAGLEAPDAAVTDRYYGRTNRTLKVVAFTVKVCDGPQPYCTRRLTGEFNNDNLLERIITWVPDPVMGDKMVEYRYSDYRDVGGGGKRAFHVHAHMGDHPLIPGGHNYVDLRVTDYKENVADAAQAVPDAVRNAPLPTQNRVVATMLAPGVVLMGGGSHNSLAVEFKDYVVMIEGPLNQQRSLAVIAETKRTFPNKPIRYLVNTHNHFDHLGGVRTYVAEGATVITDARNVNFYNRVVLAPQPRSLQNDRLSTRPFAPTGPGELAVQGFTDQYTISDGNETIQLYHVDGLNHSDNMLVAYLPKEKILVNADLYSPPAAGGNLPNVAANAVTLFQNVKRLKLDVAQHVPIHGNTGGNADFERIVGPVAARAPQQGGGG
jgi:glyoxylase-like metal-dependent hydrolase (beta-lactamase superfamily II)